jgi:hypothetical protein
MTNMASKEIHLSDADFERIVRSAAAPTPDDCTATLDGRRIDTREKLHAWIEELARRRELDEQSDITL